MATEQALPVDDRAAELIVQQGRDVLRMLQHAARAAHLESQVVELQIALEKASDGDVRTLHAWLDRYHQQPAEVLPLAANRASKREDQESRQALRESMAADPAPVAPLIGEHGWAVYLDHAQRRLGARVSLGIVASPWDIAAAHAPAVHTPDANGQPGESALQTTVAGVSSACLARDPFALDDQISTDEIAQECWAVDGDDTWDVASGPDSSDELSADAQLRLGLSSTGKLPAEVEGAARSLPLRQRLLGSYGMSVAGHALVLLALGTITYKVPQEGNSLGSQVLNAAESRSEIDLSSEVEMIEPVDLPNTEAITEPTALNTVASELSQLSRVVTPTSVEVDVSKSPGSSIANSIGQATSQSQSAARGVGAASMNGSFFGVGTGGNYFCYVVDSSGSMRGGAWESAKAELMRSLKSLKATQKFYIVFFANEFEALPEPGSDQPAMGGLFATTDNIEHARRWIHSVELRRGGPPNEALAWAIEREPDAIYLLTDGVTKVDVCGYLRKANRTEDIVSGTQVRVPIHAIAYHSLDGQQLMRQLAKENQGQFIYVPKPKK